MLIYLLTGILQLQLRIFGLGDYPGLSGLAHCPPRGGQSEEETSGEAEEGGRQWPALRTEEEATGQGRWTASRSWKRQERILPRNLQKEPALLPPDRSHNVVSPVFKMETLEFPVTTYP